MVFEGPGDHRAGISEAEYEAMSEIVEEVLFLRYRLLSCLSSRVTPSTSWRTTEGPSRWPTTGIQPSERGISTSNTASSDAVDEGKVRVTYAKTEDQHADVLTKTLDRRMFEKNVNALMNVG